MQYIACEDLNFFWEEKEVMKFEQMWKEGLCITDIATALDRHPNDVVVLVIDRRKKQKIQPRDGGLLGNRLRGVS
ncbi:helix-turn-helix domain containing protein [Chengkuizengella axinellae]|uniref:Helix-turn-helix domain containing protein n=1 Tax=Chengkuizengella axinellae TaxID=3064388 RepID=A0ABT9J6T9_9BACL|nr:helix-turn-helix domain containing protein [Chengkuizengella sp. 2205SS18-9]MDP5277198.1 helix-turn-helix domain containing protein [Chengkuizengella sp. 2205SS18-9]